MLHVLSVAALEIELSRLQESSAKMSSALEAETKESEGAQRLQDDLDRLDAGGGIVPVPIFTVVMPDLSLYDSLTLPLSGCLHVWCIFCQFYTMRMSLDPLLTLCTLAVPNKTQMGV